MRRTLALAALLAGALACSGGLMSVDTAALSRYTDVLIESAGGKPGVGPCAMFGQTREGYCTITRTAGEVRSLVDGKNLAVAADPETKFHGDSCASVAGFGTSTGTGTFELLPGATRFVPNGTLPPSEHNVKLDAIVVAPNGTDVCFQFQFPYG